MNELMINDIKVEDLIYEVRGKQVMLASDVARLYQTETKRVNEVVKRNINRFPEGFCFQLTLEEAQEISSRSQFATLNKNSNNRGNNIKYLPYVFTKHGVMMLSGLLKSDIAAKVNVAIINAFVAMRKYFAGNTLENRVSNLETKLIDYDHKFELIFDKMDNEKVHHLFFDGQIYDAYSLLCDILNEARDSIILIDNYLDKSILDVLSKIDKNVFVTTKNTNQKALEMYKKQYQNIKIKCDNSFHDRFIIIDQKILYHCGASFKDLGKKCFAITKMEDKEILNQLLVKIDNLKQGKLWQHIYLVLTFII